MTTTLGAALLLTAAAMLYKVVAFSAQRQAAEQAARQGSGAAAPAADAAPATAPGVRPEDVMATLEKLGELKSKGILTQEEFDAKKTELLKKLI